MGGAPDRRSQWRPAADDVFVELRDPLPPGPLRWGVPMRCPRCLDMALIDEADVDRQVMRLRCPTCRFRFEITADQIRASWRARRRPQSSVS